jgi:hypothetical protein
LKPGEDLQRLIFAIERVICNDPSVSMESPCYLADKDTGEPREHDVVLRFKLAHHVLITALECRDRSRKVGVPEIEQFKNKCDRTGVHKGIVVSSKGFSSTAITKANALEIGCLSLDEVGRFNWCLAPGIAVYTRDLLNGPKCLVETAQPVNGVLTLFDQNGTVIDAAAASRIAQKCLDQRDPIEAAADDEQARSEPVTRVFSNLAAPSFYVIDGNGKQTSLTRMTIPVTYKVRYELVPFNFHQYFDAAKGSEVTSLAWAPIQLANVNGRLLLHTEKDGIRVSFVPESPVTGTKPKRPKGR